MAVDTCGDSACLPKFEAMGAMLRSMRATLTALEIQLGETLAIVEAELKTTASMETAATSCSSNDVAPASSQSADPDTTQHASLAADLNGSSVIDATRSKGLDDLNITQPAASVAVASTTDDIEQLKREAITPQHIAGVSGPSALIAEEPSTFLEQGLSDQEPSSPPQPPVEACAAPMMGLTDNVRNHDITAAPNCSEGLIFDVPPEDDELISAHDAKVQSSVMTTALGLEIDGPSKHQERNVVCVTNYENTAAICLMAFDAPPEDDKPVAGTDAEVQSSAPTAALCLKAEGPSKHQERNVVCFPGERQWIFRGLAASVVACLTLLTGVLVLSDHSKFAALSRLGGVTSAR